MHRVGDASEGGAMAGIKEGISRRNFLEGAGLAALGAGMLGSGMLAGCAPAKTTVEKTGSSASGGSLGEWSGQSAYAQINPQEEIDVSNSISDLSQSEFAKPFNIGKIEIANRFVKTAATSGVSNDEVQAVGYFGNIAKGGVGAVFVEGSYAFFDKIDTEYTVSAMGPDTRLTIEDSPLKAICAEIHSHDVPAFIQMKWGTPGLENKWSNTPETGTQYMASEMSLDDIAMFAEDVANSAQKLQSIGFDGIEINAAGNNVPGWFLSRFRNDRPAGDPYGPATFESRTRFIGDLISAIKTACGEDFPVQVRMNGVEENDTDLGQDELISSVEESAELAKCIEAAGADSLHFILGVMGNHNAQFMGDGYFSGVGVAGANGFGTFFDFNKHFGGHLDGNHSGLGLMLGATEIIKQAVSIPVGAATYMDPAQAPDYFEAALADGRIDFLCINRPVANADNEYVHKFFENRLDEIRPCCRCLHCAADFGNHMGTTEGCRVNACKARAFTEEMPEGYEVPAGDGSKNVMVIGGGPAGMEAARVCAERGYSVALYEKSAMGGLLDFAESVKGKHEHLGQLKDWFIGQLNASGVEIVTGKEVDAAFVREQKPDVVILAAGGARQGFDFQGTQATPVISVTDFLMNEPGDDVVVCGFNVQAYDTAMYLLAHGKNVTVVSNEPEEALGKGQSASLLGFTRPAFYAAGGRVLSMSTLDEIGDGEVKVTNVAGVQLTIKADAVIDAADMVPNTSLADELSGEFDVKSVGDCADPWDIQAAIATANLVARAC
mgnify:FL=1